MIAQAVSIHGCADTAAYYRGSRVIWVCRAVDRGHDDAARAEFERGGLGGWGRVYGVARARRGVEQINRYGAAARLAAAIGGQFSGFTNAWELCTSDFPKPQKSASMRTGVNWSIL